jgi:PGF-pre-PGF domain-containing protein
MLKMMRRFFAILSAFFILMAGFGVVPVLAGDSGDNSTNVEITEVEITNTEETNIEEEDTTVIVDDADDVITSGGGSVIYQEENTEITDIDDIDTTIIDNSDDDYSYTFSDDDTTNITTIETTDLDNSTLEIDNSYNHSDNSRTTIQTIETTNVNVDNSQRTNVSFTESTVVNNINFVSKDSGETKVIVKEIEDKTILTKTPPVGNVYTSFNIFIDNAEVNSNIEDAAVDFKVEKTWLIANGFDKSTIVLNMYEGGKWVEVPVIITGEDSQFVYFNAEVSEYSTFAITGKTVTVDKVLKQTGTTPEEEIDEPTKNVIIKLLEVIIEMLEGK